MDESVFKPDTIYATCHKLNHKPSTAEEKKRVQFMDSHDFSFTVNPKTNNPEIKVTEKMKVEKYSSD